MEKILILDDEKSILDLLVMVFEKEGYQVKTALSAPKALELIEKEEFDLIITDIKLPEMSGLEVLKKVKNKKSDIPVIVITAYGTVKQAVETLKAGAMDYILKPFDVDELKIVVSQGLERKRLQEENLLLRKELKDKYNLENIIGKSRKMREIYGLIEKIASADSTVLISGESGTGKEMAARTIHTLSQRRDGRFVSINCGALPENLLESELFGYVKGAFTGAVSNKKGMFEAAEEGCLFLDEVGEMAPWTQVKLLRSLQDKKIRRVGSTEEIPIDARIIAATNQDLKQKIKEGQFREDLYYRLNVISLEMPPLRERKEDIPLLISYFLDKYCQQMNRVNKRITPKVMKVLEAYPWPGNVRELENLMERIVAIEERQTITEDCLPEDILNPDKAFESELKLMTGFNLKVFLDGISKKYIKEAYKQSEGNLKKTSELLGISYRSLRHLIDKYELKFDKKNEWNDDEGYRGFP
ncbi:MAG: sigma-54-dependent transcriptional regulator [Candidatus Aminicenantaceae bacterium]